MVGLIGYEQMGLKVSLKREQPVHQPGRLQVKRCHTPHAVSREGDPTGFISDQEIRVMIHAVGDPRQCVDKGHRLMEIRKGKFTGDRPPGVCMAPSIQGELSL